MSRKFNIYSILTRIKGHFTSDQYTAFSQHRAVYEIIMWKNVEEPDKSRMRI